MLTQGQVQRYTAESGLRDLLIAEKEVILTFLLQLLTERGLLERMAFKGGTCLRKMIIGSQGRFSTDLDFTGLEEHNHEDVILAMMDAFQKPYHGIQFAVPDEGYYETQDGLSWGVNPTYTHQWNTSDTNEVKLQISRRETPTLPPVVLPQQTQSYFRFLPFDPAPIRCLALEEILAEKIRACYQRNKARDIYDLGMFAGRPFNQALIRRLVVLKLWQANDRFDPDGLMQKFKDGRDFDWDDLKQLTNKAKEINKDSITRACVHGFAYLTQLTPDEVKLTSDRYQRLTALAQESA